MNESTELPHPDRRRLIRGAALLGVAGPVLAACGKDQSSAGSTTPQSQSPAQKGSASSGGGGAGGAELVAAADVPVGGGVILDGQQIVVTQPADGEFKAFSAICTHQGCPVGSVAGNTITCPCHGSQFSAEDGSVTNGPATAPLAAVKVQVKGGSIIRS